MPEQESGRKWLPYALPFLIMAAVLRFWDFSNMPFTNDELSAWKRLHHPDLFSIIKLGVEPDMHPALVQVFMWLWVSAFGDAEWVVKFPFVLMSLGALMICFHLAFRIYGHGAAMITGAALACSQVVLVFSTVARPYASGMLICAALVWFWYRIVFEGAHKYVIHLWFAFMIALSVYNHYFSGLLGIVVWFTGLIYWRRLDLKKYIGSAVLAFILFLPHLKVSLVQVSRGGIGGVDGYLGAPKPDFALEWMLSLFNYNPILTIAGSLLLLISLYAAAKSKVPAQKAGLLFTAWFVFMLALGYFYSLLVNPLLHHGTIFFVTPLLVIAISGSLPAKSISAWIAALVAIMLVWSLFTERKHYEVMHRQPYARTAQHLNELSAEAGSTFAIVHQEPTYLEYYIQTDTLPYTALNTNKKNYTASEEINAMLISDADIFYTDGRNATLVYAAHIAYPSINRYNGFIFSGFHFRKVGISEKPLYHNLITLTDSHYTDAEYVDLLNIQLPAADITFGDEIGAMVQFAERPASDIHLVFDLRKNGESLHWSSGMASTSAFSYLENYCLVHQILLWNTFTNENQMKGAELKIYLWNPEKVPMNIAGRQVDKLEANPNFYGQLTRRP